MGEAELAVTGIFLVFSRIHVAVYIIAIEHAAQGHLAIAAHTEPVAAGMTHHRVGGIYLCLGRERAAQEHSGE